MVAAPAIKRVMHIISGDLWAGAEVQAYTLLKYLKSSVELQVVLMNEGELAKRLRQLDIPVTVLPETQLSSLSILKQLISLIRFHRPEVIHTHRQKENIFGNFANVMAFPLKKNRPKSVRTSHGAPESTPKGKQKIQVWLDSWVGNHLQQAVIAVSNDLAKKLALIFPVGHIQVVHNGVDCQMLLEQIREADFKRAQPDFKHIGIIGRLQPVKRIDIFIEMAALLINNEHYGRQLQFHIIGDGNLRPMLEKKTQQLLINTQIKFHGHRDDMASCIASLDAIVMCSDHEGTPMTALEALALNTHLVAHDVGGLHELLYGQSELLVSEHNPSGYAAAVNNVLTQSPAKVSLNPSYTAETNAAAILSIYQSC